MDEQRVAAAVRRNRAVRAYPPASAAPGIHREVVERDPLFARDPDFIRVPGILWRPPSQVEDRRQPSLPGDMAPAPDRAVPSETRAPGSTTPKFPPNLGQKNPATAATANGVPHRAARVRSRQLFRDVSRDFGPSTCTRPLSDRSIPRAPPRNCTRRRPPVNPNPRSRGMDIPSRRWYLLIAWPHRAFVPLSRPIRLLERWLSGR